jgi:two-component system CheB/CheR fusion protein
MVWKENLKGPDATGRPKDEALEFAESVIDTVREPLIVLDHDLRVVKVSRSFYEFFKVDPKETVGQLIYDLGNKQWDIPKLRELLETILPQKTTFDNYEVEHDFATIGRRIMLLNARQIQRAMGKERIILLAIEDITEKKKLEREVAKARDAAEAATRAKSAFLANMSHELRTPLNSIVGFSEVLEDQMFGPLNEKQKRYVENVVSSSKHLLNLINDVLDLSKVEAGKMELEPGKIRLKTTLEYALDMQREKALKHNIDLALKVAPEANIEMMADERKLKQVMFNLLSNALKFTPDGGRVTVGVKKAGGEIEIGVEDTGLGVKAEDIPKLFTAFSQLDTGPTRSHEGTGLGLALTKQLVEMHGGRIRAESAGEGKGAKFTFTLPIKEV